MWARIIEFIIAIWLISSSRLFYHPANPDFFWVSDLICGAAITVFALFSLKGSLQKLHLCSIGIALYLVVLGFSSSAFPPPALFQNYLILGLLLLMFALVPSSPSLPPAVFKESYLKVSAYPSRWSQRIHLSCYSALATAIAVYMGLYQWGIVEEVWDPIFREGTDRVLNSDVSMILLRYIRMPDAILGAITYFGDIIFAFAGSSRRWQDRPWLVLLFGLYVIPPALVSILLVVIQGTVLNTWCFLCLITACISVFLILLAFSEVKISICYLTAVWKKRRDRRLLWNTLWGKPSEAAYEVARHMKGTQKARYR